MNALDKPYQICQLANQEPLPWNLLLLADPDGAMIQRYLPASMLYGLWIAGQLEGICVILSIQEKVAEIKNIAIASARHGQGWGRILIDYVIDQLKSQGFEKVVVGTANSSIGQIAFYQKSGFELAEIRKGFFLTNYSEEIWENGIQAKHLVLFEKILH